MHRRSNESFRDGSLSDGPEPSSVRGGQVEYNVQLDSSSMRSQSLDLGVWNGTDGAELAVTDTYGTAQDGASCEGVRSVPMAAGDGENTVDIGMMASSPATPIHRESLIPRGERSGIIRGNEDPRDIFETVDNLEPGSQLIDEGVFVPIESDRGAFEEEAMRNVEIDAHSTTNAGVPRASCGSAPDSLELHAYDTSAMINVEIMVNNEVNSSRSRCIHNASLLSPQVIVSRERHEVSRITMEQREQSDADRAAEVAAALMAAEMKSLKVSVLHV